MSGFEARVGSSWIVATGGTRGAVSGEGDVVLARGRTVRFSVLPARAPGEVSLRIGSRVYIGIGNRSMRAGTVGRALVKSIGPPLLLHILDDPILPEQAVRLPALLGLEELGAGTSHPLPLAPWNGLLADLTSRFSSPSFPGELREAILLSRFLVFALVGSRSGARSDTPGEGRDLEELLTPRSEHMAEGSGTVEGDPPFWFFVPFPGTRAPVLFPAYRRREEDEPAPSWGVLIRFPDVGPVLVRFVPHGAGWTVDFAAEHAEMAEALEAGAPRVEEILRGRGFPVRGVSVRRAAAGTLGADVCARFARDAGISVVRETA